MVSHALWKGQLRLSLVSIPVEVYSATRPGARFSFRQIHEPSGKPVHYDKVVEGVGPVDMDEIVKGYEYESGKYVLLEPEEIDAVKLETKKALEMVQFVDSAEISPIYYDKPYYVVPTDDLAEDAYRVVRDALRKSGKVGLGQLTLRGREYIAAIRPCGDGLLLETLHYADELKKADPMFSGLSGKTSDKELLEVATALIDRKSGKFDAASFKDNYSAALKELVKKKLKGKKIIDVNDDEEKSESRSDNVIDLMSALKKSLEGGEEKKAPAKKPAAKPTAPRKKKSA
ncbi:DNA end-binding protein Ku [Pararhizobium capsulatum DSM 1112]|uniref:Non-homologous end joining protein Ku n=1 Tax=Pararhizobium capsulatum DSM 1112 TaxID=1121113 RepID=A0ABU0BU28_9HYPH|nr:Ku protein [Pararhizobium capsulatum]MDQ0321769.1 DNA end-binding protein Ku [Pararhizobium capsulatum DSM 1112]